MRWPSRNPAEDGFTLIEVLVAMGVMFSALVVLAYTMASSLSAVGFSRQRTEATALANQALEQIRALPANQLYLSSADLGHDTALVSCGTGTCFNARTVPVANFGATPSTTPFTPSHITTATALPGNTVYTIKSYLTYDPSDATKHTLVATVQVSWSGSQKGGVASSLQVESKIYNNQFNDAPPGVHTFLANASGAPGTISVTGSVLGGQVANIAMNLPSTSAGMGGTSLPNSTSVGTGTGVNPVSGGISNSYIKAALQTLMNTPTASATAQTAVGSVATDGPRTDTETATIAGSLTGSLGLDLGNLTTVTGNVGPSGSASAVATSAAGGGTSTPNTPSLPSNGLGFGQGSASQTGAVGANLSVSAILPLATIGLVDLVPTGNSNPDLSTVAQNGSSANPQLQTFTASASQSFSELDIVNVGLLGATGIPLLKLTAFDKTANVCAGPGTCVAPASTDTGNISILGGTPIPIQTLLSDTAPALALVNKTLTGINLPLGLLGGLIGVNLGVTGAGITLGGSATASGGSGAGVTAASASVPSPLAIDLTLDATVLGVQLLHVNIHVDLGSITTSASYS